MQLQHVVVALCKLQPQVKMFTFFFNSVPRSVKYVQKACKKKMNFILSL